MVQRMLQPFVEEIRCRLSGSWKQERSFGRLVLTVELFKELPILLKKIGWEDIFCLTFCL
jgi:hypothetical protein